MGSSDGNEQQHWTDDTECSAISAMSYLFYFTRILLIRVTLSVVGASVGGDVRDECAPDAWCIHVQSCSIHYSTLDASDGQVNHQVNLTVRLT